MTKNAATRINNSTKVTATLIAGLLMGAALAGTSSAQSGRSGKAVKVVPAVEAGAQGQFRTLVVNADIMQGETIRTTAGGEAQLLFEDGTKVAVGPNSTLILEEYVFASRGKAERVTLNALGGSFRFISGKSGSQAYKIKTPTAVLAVRGTAFDFTVVPE